MLARPDDLSRYELAALITGFSLLAYELAAARILAPSIGSSMYIWTSVIGVIIAALSVGYAAGGLAADKRARRTDIAWLLLLAATAIVLTWTLSDTLLQLITDHVRDPRLQGLTAATLLFSPTSLILGVISPYLAKLRVVSLARTGTSVALLSAANALGGIIGTFSVGFIFFGYIGSRETLLFTALLLAGTSLLFAPYQQIAKRLGIGSTVLLFALLAAAASFPHGHISTGQLESETADIDTPTARYKIVDRLDAIRPARLLITGPRGAQSGVYLNGSSDLAFFYTRQMAGLVAKSPNRDRILILGGGAFTLPHYLAEYYPSSRIDVVETDSRLPGIAKQYFYYRDHANVHMHTDDARAFLNANKTHYDIILVDVYSELSVPFSLTTREYAASLKSSLRPGGLVLANVVGSDTHACRPLLRAVHASYAKEFAYYRLYPEFDSRLHITQNIIFAYSGGHLDTSAGQAPGLDGGMLLTDNYAPVERLQLQCQMSET